VSITPASDIVLEVARAADPARSATATARLARLAKGEPASGATFAELVDADRPERLEAQCDSALAPGGGARTKQRPDTRADAVKGLEKLVLQKLVEAMLPKETGTLFGRGTSGEVWRSMLAEQLAAQIGSSVDLGVGRAVPWLTRSEPSAPVADRHDEARQSPGHRSASRS
jgi:flagellar protein FlgJ